MLAVVAVYPSGHRVLCGYAHIREEADGIIADVCAANGGQETLEARGIYFNVEMV